MVAAAIFTLLVAAPAPHSLHVVLRETTYHETPLSEVAGAVGATRLGLGELFDATATTRVGSILMTCTATEIVDGEAVGNYRDGVMRLNEGSIAFQTATTAADTAKRIYPYIVTGGSGIYAGMRGCGFNDFGKSPSSQDIYLTR